MGLSTKEGKENESSLTHHHKGHISKQTSNVEGFRHLKADNLRVGSGLRKVGTMKEEWGSYRPNLVQGERTDSSRKQQSAFYVFYVSNICAAHVLIIWVDCCLGCRRRQRQLLRGPTICRKDIDILLARQLQRGHSVRRLGSVAHSFRDGQRACAGVRTAGTFCRWLLPTDLVFVFVFWNLLPAPAHRLCLVVVEP